jgi:hypothetical protein
MDIVVYEFVFSILWEMAEECTFMRFLLGSSFNRYLSRFCFRA